MKKSDKAPAPKKKVEKKVVHKKDNPKPIKDKLVEMEKKLESEIDELRKENKAISEKIKAPAGVVAPPVQEPAVVIPKQVKDPVVVESAGLDQVVSSEKTLTPVVERVFCDKTHMFKSKVVLK